MASTACAVIADDLIVRAQLLGGAIMTPAAPRDMTSCASERIAAKPGADTPTMIGSLVRCDHARYDRNRLLVVELRRLAELPEQRDAVDAGGDEEFGHAFHGLVIQPFRPERTALAQPG